MKNLWKYALAGILMNASFASMAADPCATARDDDRTYYVDPAACSAEMAAKAKEKVVSPAANNIKNGAQTIGEKFIDASCNPTQGRCETYSKCPDKMTCSTVSGYGTQKATALNDLKTNSVVNTPRSTAITDLKNPQTWANTLKGDIATDRANRQANRNSNSVGLVKTVDPDTGEVSYPAGSVAAKEQDAIKGHQNGLALARAEREKKFAKNVSQGYADAGEKIKELKKTYTYSTAGNDPYAAKDSTSEAVVTSVDVRKQRKLERQKRTFERFSGS